MRGALQFPKQRHFFLCARTSRCTSRAMAAWPCSGEATGLAVSYARTLTPLPAAPPVRVECRAASTVPRPLRSGGGGRGRGLGREQGLRPEEGVCVLSDAACVPRVRAALVCNLARCCFACVYSSIVFFRCLSCACARPCKRAFERASISTGLLAQWFVRACSTHACRRTRTHADAWLGARCLLCCRVSLVLQPEARTSVVKDHCG